MHESCLNSQDSYKNLAYFLTCKNQARFCPKIMQESCILTRFLQDLGKILERSYIKSWQDLGRIFDRVVSYIFGNILIQICHHCMMHFLSKSRSCSILHNSCMIFSWSCKIIPKSGIILSRSCIRSYSRFFCWGYYKQSVVRIRTLYRHGLWWVYSIVCLIGPTFEKLFIARHLFCVPRPIASDKVHYITQPITQPSIK